MSDFDEGQWNRLIGLMCVAEEFNPLPPHEYQANILLTIGLARSTEKQYPQHFKVNYMVRKRLSKWIEDFAQYQDFSDGCWLLVRYYSTDEILRTADDLMLIELHRRWSSLVSLSMYYGNKHQMSNFIPFAHKVISGIVGEMMRRKTNRVIGKRKNQNVHLDADKVKNDINCMTVFAHYFPGMKKKGKDFKAPCRWHVDGKNPNLVIYPDGHCHCYSCNAHYDVFGMIMSLDKVDFATAVATADRLGH